MSEYENDICEQCDEKFPLNLIKPICVECIVPKEYWNKLLEFTKRMTDIGDLCCATDVEILATKVLSELGLLEND